MRTLKELVRENIYRLAPYSCARDEFKGEARISLDANESPFNAPYNRYPDPLQKSLKREIARVKGIESIDNIFLGVGSDECIDACYRVFCEPRKDNVVAFAPTYGMYKVCADVNDVEYRTVLLHDDYSLDVKAMLDATDDHTKVMWVCSPNNPTGNSFPIEDIRALYDGFDGILVVDEAYIDFSSLPSMTKLLKEMPRMIVMQTLSKAWASASVRLGMAFASKEIIDIFNKVKYPYNINLLTQRYALECFSKSDEVKSQVEEILACRATLIDALKSLATIKTVYPTDANFVLVKVEDANALYKYLCDNSIIVRNRNSVELCAGCVRITVGTEEENKDLVNTIKQYGRE